MLGSLSLALIALIGQAQAYHVRQLYQFPNSTFTHIENVAIRPNGQLLLTIITEPCVYSLDPAASAPTPQLLYRFPSVTSMLGIAETSPDVFAVVAANYSIN